MMLYLSLAQVRQGLISFLYNVVFVSAPQQNKWVISKYSWAFLLSSPPISLLGLLSYSKTNSTRALHSNIYLLHSWGQGRWLERAIHVQVLVAVLAQEGLEKLFHVECQEGQQWGDILHPKWGAAASLWWSSREEIPQAQGKINPSKMVGVARGYKRADTLKSYSQETSQSNHTRKTAMSNSMKLIHARGAT